MNALMGDLRERFHSLEPRDRLALVSLSIFLGLVLFYVLIWVPIGSYLDDSRADYDRQLSLLQYLKSTEDEAKAAAGSGNRRQLSGQSMLTQVTRTARAVGVNPTRMQPEGEDAVSVWFDAAPFTQIMQLIERLEKEQGIVVRQVSMDRRDQPGTVSARIVLRN